MTRSRISSRFARLATLTLVGLGLFALPGCLVSGEKDVYTTGDPVAQNSLMLLEAGASTEDDVLELLGVPSRLVNLDDDRTIYVYEWSTRRESSTAIFLLFGGSSSTQTRGAANVEFRDGVVTRWWTDSQ